MVPLSCHFDERLTGLNKQVNPNIKIIIENQLSEALLYSDLISQKATWILLEIREQFWHNSSNDKDILINGCACSFYNEIRHGMSSPESNKSLRAGYSSQSLLHGIGSSRLDSECCRAGERDSTGFHTKIFTAAFPTVLCSSCFASLVMSGKKDLIKHKSKMKCLYLSSSAFWYHLPVSTRS